MNILVPSSNDCDVAPLQLDFNPRVGGLASDLHVAFPPVSGIPTRTKIRMPCILCFRIGNEAKFVTKMPGRAVQVRGSRCMRELPRGIILPTVGKPQPR